MGGYLQNNRPKDAAPLLFIYIDREDIMDFIAVQGVKRRKLDQTWLILGLVYV